MTISLKDRMKVVLTNCVYHMPKRVSGSVPLISEADEAFLATHLQTIMWEFDSAVESHKADKNNAVVRKQVYEAEKAAYREGYRTGYEDGAEAE